MTNSFQHSDMTYQDRDILTANTLAYDNSCNDWQLVRSAMPVNTCIQELVVLLPPAASILDVGCGTGNPIAAYLDHCGFVVTGFDPSAEMIKRAEQLPLKRAIFERADLLNYTCQTAQDAVIAFDSLFHLSLEEQVRIYPVIASFLKPGGYFLFTHGKERGEITGRMFNQTFHYAALEATELKKRLEQADFDIINWQEDYHEPTAGQRDLLVLARKKEMSSRLQLGKDLDHK